ncbi:hypothetical protein [Streptomyces laurentii]
MARPAVGEMGGGPSARRAAQYADQAGTAGHMLTHLWPGTDPKAAHESAAETFRRPIHVATPGLVTTVGPGAAHPRRG